MKIFLNIANKIKKILLILAFIIFLFLLTPKQTQKLYSYWPRENLSFLLITLDTWRWDYIGVSGSGKVLTPNLDEIAKEGLYIKEVLTPYPLTTPAHATILTGLNPVSHGVLDCTSYKLNDSFKTMAEIFKENGYKTAAFVSSETLNRRFGLDQGFDIYDDSDITRRGDTDWLSGTRDGEETTKRVLEYLNGENFSKIFLWVHYFDMHVPYRSRPKYDLIYKNDPYASQAAFVDEQVGILLKKILNDKKRKWKILIVGDHGEGLGENGEYGHGYTLYKSVLHIPFIIYPKPENIKKIELPFSLEDIFPTVLDLLDIKSDLKFEGISLFKLKNKKRNIYSLTLMPSFIFSANPVYGLRHDNFMYIKHGNQELYDMEKDTYQKNNLIDKEEYRETFFKLSKYVLDYFSYEKLNKVLKKNLKLDYESERKLESLGYLSSPDIKFKKLQRVDLLDLIKDVNKLDAAKEKGFITQNWNETANVYREIIAKYPNGQVLYKNLGKILINLKKYEEAEEVLKKAVELDDNDLDSILNLGTIYYLRKEFVKSKYYLEKALILDPNDPQANKNMAILCSDHLKDINCAIKYYTKYLELVPNSREKDKIINYLERVKSINK